jgi:23S rRNA pseudouridine1911/1915/1917 synthase
MSPCLLTAGTHCDPPGYGAGPRIEQYHTVSTTALQAQREPVPDGGDPGNPCSRRLIQQHGDGSRHGRRPEPPGNRYQQYSRSDDDQHRHDDGEYLQETHADSHPPLSLADQWRYAPGTMASQTTPDEAFPPDSFTTVAGAAARGQRVDRFLADAIGTISRSRVKSLIEQGQVRQDGVVLGAPAEPVRPGATYVMDLPAASPATPRPQNIPFAILYEDADLIVLDKPAGLVVHPAPGNEDGTLVNALLAHCGDTLPGIGGERRPGIVHRLDKDSTGVMVVAKTELASAALTAAFAARDLDRAYLALAWGLPSPLEGEIEGAIGRDPRDRKRMAVVTRGGRAALTRYRTARAWQTAASLLDCRLATGRTHQIRVHLASRGNPIVGDPLYLRRVPAVARTLPDAVLRRLLDFPRQALHAARLGFAHPRTGRPLDFATEPPGDMAGLIDCLDALHAPQA